MFAQIDDFPDYFIDETGSVASVRGSKWRELKPGLGKRGYLLVSLYNRDGKKITRPVHILVAEAFLGPRPQGHEVDHKNYELGKTYNHYTNLEYVTPKENIRRAWINGLCAVNRKPSTGEKYHRNWLTDEQVVEVLSLKDSGIFQKEVARQFGISQSLVSYLWSGKKRNQAQQ